MLEFNSLAACAGPPSSSTASGNLCESNRLAIAPALYNSRIQRSTIVEPRPSTDVYIGRMALGDKINEQLNLKGWKPADLARRSGVDLKTISAIIARNSKQSIYAPQFAAAFGISLEELFEVDTVFVKPNDSGQTLSDLERSLVHFFRLLRDKDKQSFFDQIMLAAQHQMELEEEFLRKHGLLGPTRKAPKNRA